MNGEIKDEKSHQGPKTLHVKITEKMHFIFWKRAKIQFSTDGKHWRELDKVVGKKSNESGKKYKLLDENSNPIGDLTIKNLRENKNDIIRTLIVNTLKEILDDLKKMQEFVNQANLDGRTKNSLNLSSTITEMEFQIGCLQNNSKQGLSYSQSKKYIEKLKKSNPYPEIKKLEKATQDRAKKIKAAIDTSLQEMKHIQEPQKVSGRFLEETVRNNNHPKNQPQSKDSPEIKNF